MGLGVSIKGSECWGKSGLFLSDSKSSSETPSLSSSSTHIIFFFFSGFRLISSKLHTILFTDLLFENFHVGSSFRLHYAVAYGIHTCLTTSWKGGKRGYCLCEKALTCRTKDVNFLCLKYWGRISSSNFYKSWMMNPTPSSLQLIIGAKSPL